MLGTLDNGKLSSVEEVLRATIGGNKSTSQELANKLRRQSRSILLQKISFTPAVNANNSFWLDVANKYDMHNNVSPSGHFTKTVNGIHKKDNRGLLHL